MRHGYGDGIDTAVSIVSARLENTQPYLSEQENTPLFALMPNLMRSANSVGVRRYSAWMKRTGTFGNAALQGARSLGSAPSCRRNGIKTLREVS